MLEILADLYDIAVYIYNFFFAGIFEVIAWLFTIITSVVMIIFYKITISMMGVTWEIVSAIFTELDISGIINNAWAQLDSTVMQYVAFFKIPEAMNNIMSAYATRLAMRFSVPWF